MSRFTVLVQVLLLCLVPWGVSYGQDGKGGLTPLIPIPAGPFTMGSDSGPADERPRHRVELPACFIDRTPVTIRQFAVFLNAMGPTGSEGERFYDIDDDDARIHWTDGEWAADPGYGHHPVVEVSWSGARKYCAWAGRRLPTEAEWEKAASGTDGRRFPWGASPPDLSRGQFQAGWNETAPVGSFPRGASPDGVLDLSGNVWEWVSSIYRSYPYDALDGREAAEPGPVRGTRGGRPLFTAGGVDDNSARPRSLPKLPVGAS